MEKMGGGGHLNVAGAQVRTPVEEAEKELQRVIDETLQEAETEGARFAEGGFL